MAAKFRFLRADEVEVRVAQIGPYYTQLLLYKDARCDMNILDEGVGPDNWQRRHTRDNANCVVSIWDEAKRQWIEKEDTGTESNTEKEKGLASDSFKRACVNWGIGRELYTAGRISVPTNKLKFDEKNGKKVLKDLLDVTEMDVENGVIKRLIISKDDGTIVFRKDSIEDKKETPSPSDADKKETPSPSEKTPVSASEVNPPLCAGCGCVIAPYGKRTAQQMAQASKAKFGRVLCVGCATEASAKADQIA